MKYRTPAILRVCEKNIYPMSSLVILFLTNENLMNVSFDFSDAKCGLLAREFRVFPFLLFHSYHGFIFLASLLATRIILRR